MSEPKFYELFAYLTVPRVDVEPEAEEVRPEYTVVYLHRLVNRRFWDARAYAFEDAYERNRNMDFIEALTEFTRSAVDALCPGANPKPVDVSEYHHYSTAGVRFRWPYDDLATYNNSAEYSLTDVTSKFATLCIGFVSKALRDWLPHRIMPLFETIQLKCRQHGGICLLHAICALSRRQRTPISAELQERVREFVFEPRLRRIAQ